MQNNQNRMMRAEGTKAAREKMATIFHVNITETSSVTDDMIAMTKIMPKSVSQNFSISMVF